jgi:predicted amidohydrolase YtcJ
MERINPLRCAAIFRSFTILAALTGAMAFAQSADTILINGKVATVDAQNSIRQAIAVRDGKILAVGTAAEVRKLAGSSTKTIDLGGRTVIPGLIDSHMHGIRAATTFSTEVNWIGAKTMAEAMQRISEGARTRPAGSWLIVAGGWTELQFAEKRRPTQAELAVAAPENPVYVQLGYGWAVMTPKGIEKLGIKTEADLPGGLKFEMDAQGKWNGAVSGPQTGIIALFDKLPKPTFDEQVQGTRKFFRELNRLGLTGIGDPGGNNINPPDYQALFQVYRAGQLTLRVSYSLCGPTPGKEFEELQSLTQMLPMSWGDDMLRFNGLGERITWAMNNAVNPPAAEVARYTDILKWAARQGMSVTMHSNNDKTASDLLDIYEKVNREIPIKDLRWSFAHVEDASPATLRRMRALGMGWTVQDEMYFGGDAYVRRNGADSAKRIPPVQTAKEIGVTAGAGTDAHRVASYNPFTALQWFLDGKTVSGAALRGPEETPNRSEALKLYTLNSAWFSHDEQKRGSLEPGKLADLAVLNKDYLTAPVDQVGGIESLLTMVGGKIVYASGPFEKWEAK